MLYRPGLLGRMPCPMDWYAGSGPPTISDDFITSGTLPAGWTFTRASANATNCLYTDSISAPAFTTYAANAPRFLDFGLLMEPIRTNLYLNSEAPVANQTITLAVGYYTLWILGPPASSPSMAVNPVTAVMPSGFGVAALGVPFTFQVTTAGTVQLVNNSATRVQLESGTTPTSYIVSTATAQTRQEDRLSKNYLGGQLNAVQGTYWVEFLAATNFNDALKSESSNRIMVASSSGSYSSNNASDQIAGTCLNGASNSVQSFFYNDAGASQSGALSVAVSSIGRVSRYAMSVSPTRNSFALDYVFGGSAAASGNRPSALLAVCLGGGGAGGNGNNGGAAGSHIPFNGFIRGFRYWPVAMPDAELKECTGAGYYGGPPVFNLDLTTKLPRIMTFARAASTGVSTDSRYTDAPGSAYNTFAGPPAPRFTSNGLIMEVGRNNYFPLGAAPATKASLALGANQGYKLWIVGTGSVTVTPGTTTPDFAGNGGVATQGNPLFIQCTVAGTVTLTVAGTVNRAQIEQVGNNLACVGPTTFIQNTTALQSRGAENLNMVPGPWWSQHDRTYFFEVTVYAIPNTQTLMSCGSADGTEREQIFMSPVATSDPNTTVNVLCENLIPSNYDPATSFMGLSQSQVLRNHKIAYATVQGGHRSLSIDGMLSTNNANDIAKPQPALLVLNTSLQALTGGFGSGVWRRFAFYDYALSDAQLVALTTTSNDPTLDISFMTGTLDGRITFTRASVGTYYDVAGVLQTATTNTPRWDYDPVTHVMRGLLIEEQRQNIQLQSSDFTSAAWVKLNLTLAAGIPGPNGATTGSGFISANGVIGYVAQTFTPVAGTTYTMSCYAKAGSQSTVTLLISSTWWADATYRVGNYNLVTGTIASITGAGASGTITPVGNGWYRITLTSTPDTVAAGSPQFGRAFANGDGVTVQHYLFGAQMEIGAFATSYIPTTAAAVTRSADVATMPTAAWFNASTSSLAADFMVMQSPNPSVNVRDTCALSDTSAANRLILRAQGISNNVAVFGTSIASTTTFSGSVGVAAAGAVSKIAATWNGTTGVGSLNGAATVSYSVGMPATLTTLTIGNDFAGAGTYLNGYVRRVQYWPRALTNAELQQVTT